MKTMTTLQSRVSAPGILLVTFISATIALTALAGVPTCAPTPPGLVGWWAGEGNASDSAGTNNGTLYGGMSFAAGEAGQAFSFNGSSGYVEMPASASLDVGAGAGLTFECWIKPAALADAQPLAEWNSGAHAGLHLWISQPPPYGGGSGSIYVNLIDTTGAFHTLTTGDGILNTSGFQHVALSYDKTTGMASLYYNGELVAAGTLGSFSPQTSVPLYLGKRISDAPFVAFDGLMDEASLYSRALSTAEIQAIYNASSAGKCPVGVAPSITTQPASQTVVAGSNVTFTATATGTAPLGYQWRLGGTNIAGATGTSLTLSSVQPAQAGTYTLRVTNAYGSVISSNAVLTVNQASGCATPPAGMVGWWRGEGNALDQVSGNTGALLNGAGFDAGVVGQAFRLNGSSNSYVEVADNPTLHFTNALTYECWAKRLNTSEVHTLVEKGGAWTGGQIDFESSLNDTYAGGSHFGFAFSGGWRGCAVTPDMAWHHYAAVAVSGQANPTLYIDGVPQAITLGGGPATMTLSATTRPLHIGALVDPRTGWFFYSDTLIDEVGFYNRALTAAEIQAIYNAGSAGKCALGAAPSITTQPASQTVVAGSNATFTVSVTGTAPLGYQWRLGGTNLAGATGTSLTLSNVQPIQAGSYSVLVTNTFGSITSSNALLAVGTPTNGLTAYYPFNGNANDASGNGNNGVVNGATLTADRFGSPNSAYRFSGTSWIQLPDTVEPVQPSGLTVSAWVQADSGANAAGAWLIHLSNRTGEAGMAIWDAGSWGVWVKLQDSNSSGYYANQDTAIPSAWTHIVAVYTQGQSVEFWVNGSLIQSNTLPNYPLYTDPYFPLNSSIGNYDYAPGPYNGFTGAMDDVRIYNRALSPGEVQAIYQCEATPPDYPIITQQPQNQTVSVGSNVTFRVTASGNAPLSYQWRLGGTNLAGATGSALALANAQPANAGNYTVFVTNAVGSITSSNALLTVNAPASCTPPPTGLAGWWRGEGNADDTVGGHNGVLVNGTGFAPGEVLQALSFDGVQNYVTNAVPGLTNIRSSFTMEFWAWPKAARASTPEDTSGLAGISNQRYAIFPDHGAPGFGGAGVSVGTNGVSVFEHSDTYLPSLLVYNAAIVGWTHIAVVYQNQQPALYINGAMVRTGLVSTQAAHPSTCLGEIGMGYGYYAGLLDEVSIYNRALSVAEIQAIYNAGSAGKCPLGVAPSITTQPASQTIVAGSNATFTATATGTAPLSYQWRFSGTNIAGATGTSLTLSNVQSVQVGSYSVLVTNAFGTVTSQVATLTILTPTPQALLNVNFAAYSQVKLGFAGTGQTASDFWNNYTAPFQPLASLSNLAMADGTPTTVGLTVQNGAGHWAFTHPDLMYNCYCYSQDRGDITLTVTNLPSGQYNFYLYGHAGIPTANTVFELVVGGADYGNRATSTNSDSLLTNFVEGAQYVVYRSVAVTNGGAPVTIKAHPGSTGDAMLNGIQIASSLSGAPVISAQPANQTIAAGSGASFSVTAIGSPPLGYQWRKGGVVLSGASNPTLQLSNTTTNDAGAYDVVVTNTFGAVTSQVATLTVHLQASPTLLNVNFAAYSQVKLGFAGTGQTASDFWNNYTAPFQPLASLSNLAMADGTPTTVGLTVQNGAGHWAFTHPDLMYNCYCYSQNHGDITLTVTNLPSGQYDFYLYGHGGIPTANTVFELVVGGADYGNRPTSANSDSLLTVFVEGAQYVVYRSVAVTNGGAPVMIKAHPGSTGDAMLNGMQIMTSVLGAPVISVQPTNQVIAAGSNAFFSVTASGAQPLGYQWRKGGVVLSGATNPTLQLSNTTTNDAGAYDVVVTNTLGAVTSQVATLTVHLQTSPTLLNVNFAAYSQVKLGFAGTGQTASDFWNNYTAPFQPLASLSNLAMADGTPTTVGLTVQNGAGHWAFTHPDLMYNCYCYSQDHGDITLTVTNLPSGQYDFYLYGHAGIPTANTVFELVVGGADYGNRATSTNSDSLLTSFVEGAQYVVYRSVAVTNGGAPVTIKAHPGSTGDAMLNGVQIVASPVRSPVITVQPTNQVITAGSAAFFSVTANGATPLGYQWRKGGVVLSGASNPTLQLSNTSTNDAGAYDVVVTNTFGAATSQVATLTVLVPTAQTLLDVNFAAYSQVKVGFAGTGQTANDFWNNCTAPFQQLVSLTNLAMANGTPTTVGLTLQNGAGTSGFTHPDLMYNCFCYSQNNGDITLTVTNLPSGQYDFYLYGHAGAASANTVFQLLIGGTDYGNQPTTTSSNWALTNFVEGAQYVVYRSVAVTNGGTPVTIKAHPGSSGYALLNGIQIATSVPGSPLISGQPTNQVITAGSDAFFSVTANGASPLGYQWRKGGVVLSGASNPTLQLSNTTTNDAGAYDVVVTNTFGAATSQVATLTVLVPTAQTLLDVNFAAYSQVKVGFAGTGQTANDFWNNCTAPFQQLVSLTNLAMASGTPTTVGLTLQNGAGTSGFTHPDLMYNCFCYSQDNGDITLTVTNLPSGQYDFYLYGHAGAAVANTVFQLLVGGTDYGNQPTTTSSNYGLTNFVEGAQYVVYRSVAVTNGGAPVTIKAHPGSSGYALLNGMQIISTGAVGQVQTQTAQIRAVVPSGSAGSTMQLQVRGAPSRVYVIQASTNLIDWVTLGLGVTDADGNVALTDPNAANHTLRFYRAVGQ